MGKGDKKSKKGKIALGTYGNSRKKNAIKKRVKRSETGKGAEADDAASSPKKTARKKAEA